MHINEDLFYCPISETFEYFGMEDINQQNEKEILYKVKYYALEYYFTSKKSHYSVPNTPLASEVIGAKFHSSRHF